MVRKAKYLAVCYRSGGNLLLESTENEVNLSKIYPTFVYLKILLSGKPFPHIKVKRVCQNANIILIILQFEIMQ